MKNDLQIHIDYLKNEYIYNFEKTIPFEELDIGQEKELKFIKPLLIEGKAYIANEFLILVLNIKFYVSLPCSICNEFFEKEFNIKNLTINEKLTKINSIYQYKDEIRNACFLEIPSYIKCSKKCPEKNNIKKYLNVNKKNFPFSNLKEL